MTGRDSATRPNGGFQLEEFKRGHPVKTAIIGDMNFAHIPPREVELLDDGFFPLPEAIDVN